MILKYFEIKKTNFANSNFFLLYGSNKGLIEETIENLKKKLIDKFILMKKVRL